MSVNPYSYSPMVGSRVASTAPFDYSDAMTLLQKIEWLRDQYNTLAEAENQNAAAYQGIIQQVNDYVSGAVAGINNNNAASADLLKRAQDAQATLQGMLNDDQMGLATAQANAQAALDAANSMANTYNAQTAALQTTLDGFNANLAHKVDTDRLVFDVKDYGAVGDGTTDDTAAIDKAIVAAGASLQGGAYAADAGTVYFPHGRYVYAGTMTPGQLIHLLGEGNANGSGAGSVIVYTGSGTCVEAGNTIAATNLLFVGPGSSTSTIGMHAYKQGGINLHNVSFDGFGTGLHVEQIWYGTLSGVSTRRCAIGIRSVYCYNLYIEQPRINGLLEDGTTRGVGMTMETASTGRLVGGAFEQVSQGITLSTNVALSIFGTHWETFNQGVVNSSANVSLVAIGCLVYLDNCTAWVDFSAETAGERVLAGGNHFKCPQPAAGTPVPSTLPAAYLAPAGGGKGLRWTLMGDSWLGVASGWADYRRGTMFGVIAGDPYGWMGPNGKGDDGVYGTLDISSSILASGMVVPYASGSRFNMSNGRSGPYTGGMMFDTSKGKPIWWNGTGWVDATGAAV